MTDFRDLAECRDLDSELWFPVGAPGGKLYDEQVREAKQVCAECPVMRECGLFALENGLVHGIYGGATEQERDALHRALPARVLV